MSAAGEMVATAAIEIFCIVVMKTCTSFSAGMILSAGATEVVGVGGGVDVDVDEAQGTVTITVPSIPQSAQMRVIVVIGISCAVFKSAGAVLVVQPQSV